MRRFTLVILAIAISVTAVCQSAPYKLGVLKYKGGGDYYANPTSLPNLSEFCSKNLGMNLGEPDYIAVGSPAIFSYPFIHMTGHGNVVFSEDEIQNLRKYLFSGGFLHIDDNYGMDQFIRPEMLRVFPELEWVELPFTHPIYHQKYDFDNGLPKIHEHDGKPPQGFGLIYKGRLICFYTYECDLGDGWEDQSVHGDPQSRREAALKMGANIVQYAFSRK